MTPCCIVGVYLSFSETTDCSGLAAVGMKEFRLLSDSIGEKRVGLWVMICLETDFQKPEKGRGQAVS